MFSHMLNHDPAQDNAVSEDEWINKDVPVVQLLNSTLVSPWFLIKNP